MIQVVQVVHVCQSIPPDHDPDAAFIGLSADDLGWRARALLAEHEARRLRGMLESAMSRIAAQSELLSRRAEKG